MPSSVSGLLHARMREDAVADLVGEVQPARDPQRLLVVTEPPAERCVERIVERLLARMPERRMAGVVPEADRLDEILVEAQRPRDDTRDGGRLERVRHPRAVVIAFRIDEDLRLPLQPAERLRMDEAVAVALKRRADRAWLLRHQPAPCLEREHGVRRQPRLLLGAHALLERLDGAAWRSHGMEGSRDIGFRALRRDGPIRAAARRRSS